MVLLPQARAHSKKEAERAAAEKAVWELRQRQGIVWPDGAFISTLQAWGAAAPLHRLYGRQGGNADRRVHQDPFGRAGGDDPEARLRPQTARRALSFTWQEGRPLPEVWQLLWQRGSRAVAWGRISSPGNAWTAWSSQLCSLAMATSIFTHALFVSDSQCK